MPLSPSATRDLLASLGHTPKRFLGQNFLVDGNIVRKSLELAQIASGDTVVEIGPGLGTLTTALLETGAIVWSVEKDRTLYGYLAETLATRFTGESAREFKIVANLPYAISTPWLDAVLTGPLPARLVLMLQLEAAQRYAATPGTKQFSAISIALQSAYDIAPGHTVADPCGRRFPGDPGRGRDPARPRSR